VPAEGIPDVRAYPALVGALALGTGIAAAEAAGPSDPHFWSLAAAALAVLALLPGRRRRLVTLRRLRQTVLLAAACAALGGAVTAAHYDLPPRHVARVLPPTGEAEVTLEGVVAHPPVQRPTGIRFRLDAVLLRTDTRAVPVEGRVDVVLGQSSWRPPELYGVPRRGDRLRLTGLLRPPPPKRNPADFDRGRWLRRQGVFATLRVTAAQDVRYFGHHLDPLGRLVEALRRRVTGAFARYLPTDAGRALQTALVLGDRRALEDDVNEAFARTGLTHLLAVSGLHVLLVGLVLYGLLKGVLLRFGLSLRRVDVLRAGLTLAVLVVYALLTGASASVVRAVVMTALLVGADVSQRPSPPLNALGVAAFVVLLIRPTQLFEAGFQLSFAAVAGLIGLGPVLRRAVPARWQRPSGGRWLATTTAATLAATLATMPILLYHFGRLPVGGIGLNLVAIPLTSAVFAAGLLTVLLAPLPALAAPIGASADALARLLVWCAETGDAWLGGLAYEGHVVHGFTLAALVGAVLTLAAWPRRRLRVRMGLVALALAGAGVWAATLRGDARPHLDLVFFDVGQGDALLVRTPRGRTMLVDAGSTESGAARRTILPHLRRYGMKHLDAVVVTHPHDDHEGGVADLLRAGLVRRLYTNGDAFDSDTHRRTLRLADSARVPVQVLRAGDALALDPAIAISVLAPALTDAHPAETNDASLVLRIAHGRHRVLLLGDAQLAAEATLVARYDTLLRSDVIKVGHHGSRTSSSGPLMRAAARPGCTAVVSVAERNVYRLPGPEVVARWRRTCHRTHLTSAHRALWLRSDGRTLGKVAWR
jgi:competence protein ComEC